jgi:hypothetical protein
VIAGVDFEESTYGTLTYRHCIRTTEEAMSVTIADITFDETPEGHALRFDGEVNLVGITLIRPKHLLEEGGGLRITLPVPSDVSARELTPALSA